MAEWKIIPDEKLLHGEELEEAYNKLSKRKKAFIREYIIDCNGVQAAIRAGYNPSQAGQCSKRFSEDKIIRSYVEKSLQELHTKKILSAQQIMEMYSDIARGEVLDQFGLDASLSDRLKALDALAKRQIDLQAKIEANAPQELTVRVIRDTPLEDSPNLD